jgi:hypothetical protein
MDDRYRTIWYYTFLADSNYKRDMENANITTPWPSMTIEWFRGWLTRNKSYINDHSKKTVPMPTESVHPLEKGR